VTRFRLSRLAQSDLAHVLATSATQWGAHGSRRYSTLLTAAMLKVAADPEGPAGQDRGDLARGVDSLHLRHARADDPEAKVGRPAHILYYRVVRPGLVEIVRVLHERMEPSRYISWGSRD
jgi:toxin ParE1/3/4